ncbi:MAG TPA: M17 family peptidase N-terminal domain-containing protein, partial [Nitriliruptorales bacterium]|nr:M17 family peptidase N-terminal domain-containing protein [Nitriliruptorales bacterium]
MPSFEVARGALHVQDVEAIALPALAAPELADEEARRDAVPPSPILGPGAQDLGDALGIDLDAELRALRFDGTVGSVARIPTRGAVPAALVLVVGAGKAEDLDADVVRRAGAGRG